MSTRRTRLNRIGVLAVLLSWPAAGGFAWSRHQAWTTTEDDVARVEAEARTAHEQREATARTAGETEASANGTDTEADEAVDASLAAISAHDGFVAQTTASETEIAGLEARIEELGRTNNEQVITVVGLQTCLDGVRRAAFAGLAGANAAGVAAMREVEDVCTATMRGLGVGGDSGFAFDFPDPYVVQVGDTYYGYATNAGAGAVQLISSPDLENWTVEGEALASLPAWAKPGHTWAPSVARVGERWVLYYTVRERASELQCISSAVATSPTGPFVDTSTGPLVCQRELGGSIDPSTYVAEDGTVFLVWKSDGIARGRTAKLWSAPVDETGQKLAWFPVVLTEADRPWEGRVVEGPAMFRQDGRIYVLYSGNNWNTDAYATGYVTCATPLGPCTKPGDNVVLRSFGSQKGTGGAETFLADGIRMVVYHAWEGDDVGYPNKRRIHVVPIAIDATGRPVLG